MDKPMRRPFFLILFLLLFLSGTAAAQGRQVKYQNEVPHKCVRINDSTLCIYSPDKAFVYVGAGEEATRSHGAVPDGYGIARALSSGDHAGAKQYEFSLCPWKRGSRHGEGLLVRPDGTVVKAFWQWNHLKSVSEQSPTDEELAELDRRIARLQATIRLLGKE